MASNNPKTTDKDVTDLLASIKNYAKAAVSSLKTGATPTRFVAPLKMDNDVTAFTGANTFGKDIEDAYRALLSKAPLDPGSKPDELVLLGGQYYFTRSASVAYRMYRRTRAQDVALNMARQTGLTIDGGLLDNMARIGDSVNAVYGDKKT